MTDVRAIQITGNGVNDGCPNYNIPRYAGDLNQVKIKAVRSQDQRADCLNIFTYRSFSDECGRSPFRAHILSI